MNDNQVIHALGIDDAYEVDRVLASGPGGVTELVSLDGSGPFVRKRIPSGLARRGVWASLAECGSARLPHVVATYEMPDEFVVVCDFVPGESLEDLVRSRGRLDERDARQALLQLCEPVAALHAHGIVHRDISPTNVIMAADGAHLIDLGIARFRTEGVTHDTTQLGTRGFASPEQCGYAQTDARSDVYSLGRVFGYLLTGVLPETPDSAEYERALADDEVVSPQAREIVRRASALEPSARYQSVAELAAALSGEKVEAPVAAPAAGRAGGATGSARGGERRRRWPLVLLAAVVAVACVALVAVWALRPGAAGDEPAAQQPVASTGGDAGADTGASDGQGAPVAAPSDADENPLEIVESGWSAGSGGYINYAFALRNNSDSVQIEYPSVIITGRSEDGTVVFSQEQVLDVIYPGQTIWWGTTAGNGTPPDDVEFAVAEPDDYNVSENAGQPSSFSVSNVSMAEDDIGMTRFTGEVTAESEGDEGMGMGSVVVVAVMRNAAGEIVCGDNTFVDRPSVGGSRAFELSVYDPPEFATYEVYAMAW